MPLVASGFLYEVIVTGLIGGVTTKNVFWYFTTGPQKDAQDVLDAFVLKVEIPWEAIASVNWDGTLVEVDEVTSVSNFVEEGVAIDGIVGGESLPGFNAFSITLSRSTKETRSGRKRIAGVAESQQSSGNLLVGIITDLDDLKDAFVDNLTVDGSSVGPVIIRKTFVDPPTVPPTLEEPSEWIYNPINGGVSSPAVTTQNSRKS